MRRAVLLLLALSACSGSAEEKCGGSLHASYSEHEMNLCKVGLDDTPALRNKIGMEYLRGASGAPQSCEKASYWLHSAAEQGSIPALVTLGEMYAADMFPKTNTPQCVEKNLVMGSVYLRGAQYYYKRIKDKTRARAAYMPQLEANIARVQGELDANHAAEANELYRKLIDERP